MLFYCFHEASSDRVVICNSFLPSSDKATFNILMIFHYHGWKYTEDVFVLIINKYGRIIA